MKSVTTLSPKTLRDLAAALEWNSPGAQARRDLSPESIDELARMILAGRKPTVGWWSRHRETPSEVERYIGEFTAARSDCAASVTAANHALPDDQTVIYSNTGASVGPVSVLQ